MCFYLYIHCTSVFLDSIVFLCAAFGVIIIINDDDDDLARWYTLKLARSTSKKKVTGQVQGHMKKTKAQQLLGWPTIAQKQTCNGNCK